LICGQQRSEKIERDNAAAAAATAATIMTWRTIVTARWRTAWWCRLTNVSLISGRNGAEDRHLTACAPALASAMAVNSASPLAAATSIGWLGIRSATATTAATAVLIARTSRAAITRRASPVRTARSAFPRLRNRRLNRHDKPAQRDRRHQRREHRR
jgi:hypothetical protein